MHREEGRARARPSTHRGGTHALPWAGAPYCVDRFLEWITSLAMLGIAAVLIIEPGARPHDDVFATITWTAGTIAMVFAAGGAIRMMALYANGHWPIYGPRMRAGCALFGGIVWSEMALSIVSRSAHPSVDIAVYAALALGEFYSAYRAAGDGRAPRRS